MKIRAVVIDARPLEAQPTGVGIYVRGLLQGFEETVLPFDIILFTKTPLVKSFHNKRVKNKVLSVPGPFWHLAVVWYLLINRDYLFHATHSLFIPIILGQRAVLTVHDLSAVLHPEWHTLKVVIISKLFFSWSVNRAGKVVCDSQATYRELIHYYPKLVPKVSVLFLGVAVPVLPLSGRPKNYVLYLGTLEPRKNLEMLLRAYKLVFERLGKKTPKLLLVGVKGWSMEHFPTLITSLGLDSKVTCRGYVSEEEKWLLLSQARLFVYPSWYEGFGLPVLEALAVGVPSIVSAIPSLREVAGENAWYVSPAAEEDWARILIKLIKQPELARQYSKLGVLWTKQFSWQETANNTIKMYEQINH